MAAGLVEEFEHGVWWVELAALSDPAFVPAVVTSTLGVHEQPIRPFIETLLDYLRPRQLLLVLDNCERLILACAHLAEALLRTCPNLRILATSREALKIAGETAWRVPSLSVPNLADGRLQIADWIEPKIRILQSDYEAVRLFVERAAAAWPTFTLTSQNAAAVGQICQRLDGIPLAIELAAAKVKVLSVEQIAARLDDYLRLLTGGCRTAPPRHLTLQAAIDYSYSLLTEQERVLFRRLSVFAGGFTLEAGEAVCSNIQGLTLQTRGPDGPRTPERWEVLDLLSRLVDKSLVEVVDQPRWRRYRLLETIRQYGWARLTDAHETEPLQSHHLDFFVQLAEQAKLECQGTEQAIWLNRLEAEHDNFRAALQWAEQNGAGETGLRLAGALWPFWTSRGHYGEGRRWLQSMLSISSRASAYARAQALAAAGQLAVEQGDFATARTLYEESLPLWQQLEDQPGLAETLIGLGNCAIHQGDYTRASTLYQESLLLWQQMEDWPGMARSLDGIGCVAYYQADCATARSVFAESLALRHMLADRAGIAVTLFFLGDVAFYQEEYAAAHAFYTESLAINRSLGHKRRIAVLVGSLGDVAFYQHDHASARAMWAESLAIWRELGTRWPIAWWLESLAGLAAVEAKPDLAVRLFGAAETLRETVGVPRWPVEQARYEWKVATACAQLDETSSNVAWTAGRAMAMEQAIEYALSV